MNPIRRLTEVLPENVLTSIAGFVPEEAAVIDKKFLAAKKSSLIMEDFQRIAQLIVPPSSDLLLHSFAARAIQQIKPHADIKDLNRDITVDEKIEIIKKFKDIFLAWIGNNFTNLPAAQQAEILNYLKKEKLEVNLLDRTSHRDEKLISRTILINDYKLLIEFFNKYATETTPTEYILKSQPGSETQWQITIPRPIVDLASLKSIAESGNVLLGEIRKIKSDPQKYERFQDWILSSVNYKVPMPNEIIAICIKDFDFSEENSAYQIILNHRISNGIRRYSTLISGLLPYLNRYQLIQEMTDTSEGAGTVHPIAFRYLYEAFLKKYPEATAPPKNPVELAKFFRSAVEPEDLPEAEDVGLDHDPKGAVAVIEFALAPETDPSYLETIFSGRYPISDEFLKTAILKACKTDDPKLANAILYANIKKRHISEGVLSEFARKAVLHNAHQVFDLILKREKSINLIAAARRAIDDKKNGFIKKIIQHLEKQMANLHPYSSDFDVFGKLASAATRNKIGIDVLNSAMAIIKMIAKDKNMSLVQMGAIEFFEAATAFETDKKYFDLIFDSKFFNKPWGDYARPAIQALWCRCSVLQENKRRVHKIFTSGTSMDPKQIIELLVPSKISNDGLLPFILPLIPFELLCEVAEQILVYEPAPDDPEDWIQMNLRHRQELLELIKPRIKAAKQQNSVLGKRTAEGAPQLDAPPHLRQKGLGH